MIDIELLKLERECAHEDFLDARDDYHHAKFAHEYALCMHTPNYPVPAIQRIVDILPNEIVVWISYPQETWPGQYYRTMGVEEIYS